MGTRTQVVRWRGQDESSFTATVEREDTLEVAAPQRKATPFYARLRKVELE
jgi:hypothetical protein